MLRAILGVSTGTGTPAKANKAPLGLGDLVVLASLVDGELNDGKRVPVFM